MKIGDKSLNSFSIHSNIAFSMIASPNSASAMQCPFFRFSLRNSVKKAAGPGDPLWAVGPDPPPGTLISRFQIW